VNAELRAQLQKLLGTVYTLDRELGGGAMARVFVATETTLGRKVVIKVLPPEVAAGVKVERFKREIQFLARLTHPHIVPLLAAGGDGNLFYYVMPFVQGESLRTRIIQQGELPVGPVIRTLREVASALAFAHGEGIVHRDIKPDNVLLSGGSAMVTDFGVAKALSVSTGDGDPNALTSLGIALGTPSYIAPEQATADPGMDHRADLYSLGAMGYEMLTGRPPFLARSPQAMLAAHISEQPVPVIERRQGIPPLLNSLIMSCLEKSPDRRPQRASEVIDLLDAIVAPRDEGSASFTATAGGSAPAAIPPDLHSGARAAVDSIYRRVLIIAGALAIIAIGYFGGRWIVSRGDDKPGAAQLPATPTTRK